LVSTTEENSSSVMRISNVSRVIPALATTTSMVGPSCSSAAAKAASTETGSPTSHATAASPSGAAPERDATTTWWPSSRIRRAIARPIPRFPPVTRAVYV